MSNSSSDQSNEEKPLKNEWMIRPCHLYEDEYDDCTSIRARFQQYFVLGQWEDCTPWKHDYYNCEKWKNNKDKAAAEEIIANEEARRVKRLNAHYNNPVWENRPEPPPDWNAPLPPFLEEKLKNTYLDIKARELREGKVLAADRMCTIL
uniref:Synaptic plasticity regulator PANTS n=1 Tax=Homalodisca liturata TaxID=320908 RepID=A0A1B6I5V6_9HEMI